MAELETELWMALEEQRNSPSANTPRSAEPSHLQIDQEHDRSETSNVRLEKLILGTPPRSQDRGDEPQQQHQRQEAVIAIRRRKMTTMMRSESRREKSGDAKAGMKMSAATTTT